jgi:hypothetical protein
MRASTEPNLRTERRAKFEVIRDEELFRESSVLERDHGDRRASAIDCFLRDGFNERVR